MDKFKTFDDLVFEDCIGEFSVAKLDFPNGYSIFVSDWADFGYSYKFAILRGDKEIDFARDKEGNNIYQKGKRTGGGYSISMFESCAINGDKDAINLFMKEIQKLAKVVIDEKGNELYYQSDNETVDFMRDKEGNEVHYQKDGKTIDYKLSADGIRTDRDGIKDNILAKKRRYYAKKMGLEKKKTPKLFRQVEAFVAKGMSSGK